MRYILLIYKIYEILKFENYFLLFMFIFVVKTQDWTAPPFEVSSHATEWQWYTNNK